MNIWCAADTESNRYQQGSDIVTGSTESNLQNLKPSRLFSENRLFLIFMNNFFFSIWNEQEKQASLHAFKCKYICTEVHANLIAQNRTIYLVAMSFGENMWGETSSIFC